MLTPGTSTLSSASASSSSPSSSSSSAASLRFHSQQKTHETEEQSGCSKPPRHKNNSNNGIMRKPPTEGESLSSFERISAQISSLPPVLDYFWSGCRTCCPGNDWSESRRSEQEADNDDEDDDDDAETATALSNNNSPKRRKALIITNGCNIITGASTLRLSPWEKGGSTTRHISKSSCCSVRKKRKMLDKFSLAPEKENDSANSQNHNNRRKSGGGGGGDGNSRKRCNNSDGSSNNIEKDDDNCLLLYGTPAPPRMLQDNNNRLEQNEHPRRRRNQHQRHHHQKENEAGSGEEKRKEMPSDPRRSGCGRVVLISTRCSSPSFSVPSPRTRHGYHPLFPVKRKLPWRNPHQQSHPPHHRNQDNFPFFPSSYPASSPPLSFSSPTIQVYFYISIVLLSLAYPTCHGNPDAKRLYDDLLSNYNRLIRPVSNNTQTVLVRLGLRLSQLIDLNLKDQILTTNVWLEHEWEDHKFKWDPHEYGGVTELYVPSENIWLPDIVLYNNADGEYVVTTMTKAVLHSDGKVKWTPPAIFKSSCEIDVRYFPFDMQTCFMKFGSWTYDGFQIDLKHIDQEPGKDMVSIGIDLREYYPSVEWDILSVPAERHEKFYPCCLEPYPDIFFNITLRRRTLFYTVNLIIPTVGISYLSILVFYLPADSGEKVALCISILLSQTMFFLLISEIIPSTSLAVPLLGKYLLFTMLLVGLSVLVTTIVLNVHYRKPSTHKMAPWVRNVFTRILPKFLMMRVPDHVLNYSQGGPSARASPTGSRDDGCNGFQGVSRLSGLSLQGFSGFLEQGALEGFPGPASTSYGLNGPDPDNPRKKYPFEIQKAIHNVKFIQTHMQRQDEFDSEDQDWGFVAMVLDRIFLMLFNTAFFVGTVMILLDAPALYDYSEAIDKVISTIAKAQNTPDIDI